MKLWSLAVACVITQFALHIASTELQHAALLPHLVAWVHDGFLLFCVAIIGQPFIRRAKFAANYNHRQTVFFAILLAVEALFAAYPMMLDSYLAFPVNIFNVDVKIAKTFFLTYAGPEMMIPSIVAVVVSWMMFRLFGRPFVRIKPRRAFIAFAILTTLTVVPRPSPQPFLSGLQKTSSVLLFDHHRDVPRVDMASNGGSWRAPRMATFKNSQFRHIIVAVMESVTAEDFEAQFLRKADGFLAKFKGHARYFSNYYTTNLDSYTSLISMVTSCQVPFRAYSEPEQYETVNDAPNAIRSFADQDYASLFVGTYKSQPFVPVRSSWTRIVDGGEIKNNSQFISVGTNRMEAALEDRAAIPLIADFVKSHGRTVVMHELVYGHSTEWMDKTGISQLDYYDIYLNELYASLATAGLAQDTLFVIVSDHGPRRNAADPRNYHIPLLFVGEGVAQATVSDFQSHLAFPLLLEEIVSNTSSPPAMTSHIVIGASDRWVYGSLAANGSFIFVEDGSGRVLNNRGDLSALKTQRAMQDLVNNFRSEFGTTRLISRKAH